MTDYAPLDAAVGAIRGANPKIAHAFDEVELILKTLSPPVVPPPPANPPLMDFRATVPTFMPVGGRNTPGLIQPWGSQVVPAYQNSDITVVDDPTWTKAFHVRVNKDSHNPWFIPPDNRVSAEMQYHQTFTNGEDVWYAQSVHWLSGEADLPLNVNDGWMLFDQLNYLGITSPALGLELRANGLGLDRNPGPYSGGSTPTTLVVRAQALRPFADFKAGWVDVLLRVRWSTNPDGIVELYSRRHGQAWTIDYQVPAAITCQTASDGVFVPQADEKQGGYSGLLPLSRTRPNPAFTFVYLLRGLTKHASRADAEESLA